MAKELMRRLLITISKVSKWAFFNEAEVVFGKRLTKTHLHWWQSL
jgi:hypothetical protein